MNYRPVFLGIIRTVGLFLSGFVIPVLGQVIALFTPVPLVLVYVRSGKVEGLTSLAVSCVIIGLIGNWHLAAVFFLSFGLMAIGIAEGMRRTWRPDASVLLGGLLPVVILAMVAGVFFSSMGKNPIIVIEQYLQTTLSEAAELYTSLGLAEMSAAIRSLSDKFVYYLVRLIPGITIATSLFQAACCYGVSRTIIARGPEHTGSLSASPFASWHAPDVWIWGLIAGLGLMLVHDEGARFIGWNIGVVYALVYLIQGVAIVDHYLQKARIKPFIRGILHTLILALPSIVFVIALGVVDIWADFRKVRKPIQASS